MLARRAARSGKVLPRCTPPAPQPQRVAGDDPFRRVILAFSGNVAQSQGSEIWKKAAGIMGRAQANIETAGGSFVRMPSTGGDAEEASTLLSVSAFGACIQPSRPMLELQRGSQDLLGCTMYIKACMPSSRVGLMMRLLETKSPLEVYTVSVSSSDVGKAAMTRPSWNSLDNDGPGDYVVTHDGGLPVRRHLGPKCEHQEAMLEHGQQVVVLRVADCDDAKQVWARIAKPAGWIALAEAGGEQRFARKVDRTTGTIYLFGVDRPGQLARITTVLTEQRVTLLNLRVQKGFADLKHCEFVQRNGGPLAENRMRIIFDEAAVDLAVLRAEIQRVGEEVGYPVTVLTTDVQSQLRAWLPSYLLRRKAFTVAYGVARASQVHRATQRSRRRQGCTSGTAIQPCIAGSP